MGGVAGQRDHGEEPIASATTWGEAQRLGAAALRQAPEALSPDLDAQLLLAHVVGAPRTRLLAFPERALAPERAGAYADVIARRGRGEPVAYLTGHREFMGLDLRTDRRALIPRPETELLVEAALADIRGRLERDGRAPVVADIGTGSGAIAIAVAFYEPRLPRVYAVDLSADALALTAENAQRTGMAERVVPLEGDLLAPLPEPVDVLLANLPYVSLEEGPSLPRDVREYEPAAALYSGGDGLEHLRRFFAEAPAHITPGATLIVEFGADQAAAVADLAARTLPGSAVRIGRDYAGWERYATIRTSADPNSHPR